MYESYVGLLSPSGLETFSGENRHVVRFLYERARRRRAAPCCCVWIVMEQRPAGAVARLVRAGLKAEGWRLAQDAAREIGRLLPEGIAGQDGDGPG